MSVDIVHPAQASHTTALAFYYGDERIGFERTARTAKTPRVLIKVHPDCRVQVAAPPDASDEEVVAAVKKRGRWIYQQLREFRARLQHLMPRQYLSGESHYYLGRQYLLKVMVAPGEKQQVKLLRGKLAVSVRRKSRQQVRGLLNDWYKTRARDVFAKRLAVLLEQALWVDQAPPLRIQSMHTQWGSCSPSGRLTLNPHLVKAPRDCIDYVILHELCHLAEHNHSARFYRLMKQVMPHWEAVKERLDRMAFCLLNGVHRAGDELGG